MYMFYGLLALVGCVSSKITLASLFLNELVLSELFSNDLVNFSLFELSFGQNGYREGSRGPRGFPPSRGMRMSNKHWAVS